MDSTCWTRREMEEEEGEEGGYSPLGAMQRQVSTLF
jgi:hypothetical protein